MGDDGDEVGLTTTSGLGELKAPVEDCWRRSYSSWSALGRRGGAGPEEKGVAARVSVVVDSRRRLA